MSLSRLIQTVSAGVIALALLSAPLEAHESHGAANYGQVLLDQFEYRLQEGRDLFYWEGDAWYGGDYHKVWLKSEGELTTAGDFEEAEAQLLYSRLIGHFWDLQAGLRYDIEPDPSRGYGVIGLQGLAPGYFEVDLQGFVGEKGDLSARFEAEYDLRITQRLVLQPRGELNVAASRDREIGQGSGVNDIELGARLRYELMRKFAPYIGVNWERQIGQTARMAREEGEDPSSLSFVAGVRWWF